MKSFRLPFSLLAIHIRAASVRILFIFIFGRLLAASISRPSCLCASAVRVPAPSMDVERTEREGNRNKITSFFGYGFFSPSFLPRRIAPLAYLLVFSISIPDSRFSKLVFNIQNEILIKSNLPIPSEYISRNDKI